ncbi:hypothetical protein PBRA_007248 [Plasmodiophora brassicae]|uniref:Uncharacterized protein n=1 Tax=Plasmodiophora brassicae TaxID=37360 RepID=A0A0G4IW39_PLABS|nr:hypothetical protein PBRA_007248 [Plasmodiophora brassicae]
MHLELGGRGDRDEENADRDADFRNPLMVVVTPGQEQIAGVSEGSDGEHGRRHDRLEHDDLFDIGNAARHRQRREVPTDRQDPCCEQRDLRQACRPWATM